MRYFIIFIFFVKHTLDVMTIVKSFYKMMLLFKEFQPIVHNWISASNNEQKGHFFKAGKQHF